MNILILGGAGFIGANLTRYCIEKKIGTITVVDSLEPLLKTTLDNLQDVLGKIRFIKGDIRDKELMCKVVKDADIIFNCAAQSSHPLSLKNPLFDIDINCRGNITLLEAVKDVNRDAVIVYTSSSTVIGKAANDIVDENHGESPLDIYSADKGVVEKYYIIYHKVYDLKTIILRFANLYGPYGKGYPDFGFINYFISLAYHKLEIPIYGDGTQTRNVMYIEDAVDLMYQSAFEKKLIGDIFFAVHKEHYSVLNIAQEIVDVFHSGSIRMIPWPDVRKRIEIEKLTISGEKLRKIFPWGPRYNLRKGLERTRDLLSIH